MNKRMIQIGFIIVSLFVTTVAFAGRSSTAFTGKTIPYQGDAGIAAAEYFFGTASAAGYMDSLDAAIAGLAPGGDVAWVDVRVYASFATAISAIGSTTTTLLIPNEQSIAASVTVPSTTELLFTRSGSLNIDTGVTVTINGPQDAGLHQIYSGSGDVSFGDASFGLYAEWWGVSPSTSATLNVTYLQSAVTSATGGVLKFGSFGTIQLNSKINITGDNTTIIGNGPALKFEQLAADKQIFLAQNRTALKFENIYFYGKGAEYSSGWTGANDDVCLEIEASSDVEISDNWFQNCPYAAIMVESSQDIIVADNIIEGSGLIESNIASGNNHQFGINIWQTSSKNIIITGNDISYVAQGIYTASGFDGNNIVVVGNNIHDVQGQHGIYGGSSNLVITGNIISDVEEAGIKIQAFHDDIKNITLLGNAIYNTGTQGINIAVTGTGSITGITIAGNTVDTTTTRGIAINGATTTKVNVIGNTIINTTTSGIYISGSGFDYNISNNILDSLGENGVWVVNSPTRIIISGNVITNPGVEEQSTAKQNGIAIDNGTDIIISNNLIADTNTTSKMVNGIYIQNGTRISVVNNKVRNSLSYDTRQDNNGSITIMRNNDFSRLAAKHQNFNYSRMERYYGPQAAEATTAEGTVAYADGSTWDALGTGEAGLTVYNGSSWVELQNTPSYASIYATNMTIIINTISTHYLASGDEFSLDSSSGVSYNGSTGMFEIDAAAAGTYNAIWTFTMEGGNNALYDCHITVEGADQNMGHAHIEMAPTAVNTPMTGIALLTLVADDSVGLECSDEAGTDDITIIHGEFIINRIGP